MEPHATSFKAEPYLYVTGFMGFVFPLKRISPLTRGNINRKAQRQVFRISFGQLVDNQFTMNLDIA
jgi:hypothetical protein